MGDHQVYYYCMFPRANAYALAGTVLNQYGRKMTAHCSKIMQAGPAFEVHCFKPTEGKVLGPTAYRVQLVGEHGQQEASAFAEIAFVVSSMIPPEDLVMQDPTYCPTANGYTATVALSSPKMVKHECLMTQGTHGWVTDVLGNKLVPKDDMWAGQTTAIPGLTEAIPFDQHIFPTYGWSLVMAPDQGVARCYTDLGGVMDRGEEHDEPAGNTLTAAAVLCMHRDKVHRHFQAV